MRAERHFILYSKYSFLCSLGLPSVAGATVALLRPSSSQLCPCLVFIFCHIYAMENRANLKWGRSLVVKCEQGIMADSLGGCDCMCVCMYVYIYIYILVYWRIQLFHSIISKEMLQCHFFSTLKLISCMNETVSSLNYALSGKQIP